MAKNDDQLELQKKYLHLEYLGKELEQMEGQKELVAIKAKELHELREAISKLEMGEGFSQFGEGIYVPAKFTDTNTFLIDVGRKIFVKMNKAEAEKYLDKKVAEFDTVLKKITGRVDELSEELQSEAEAFQCQE